MLTNLKQNKISRAVARAKIVWCNISMKIFSLSIAIFLFSSCATIPNQADCVRCLNMHSPLAKMPAQEKKAICTKGLLGYHIWPWVLFASGGGWLWNFARYTPMLRQFPCPHKIDSGLVSPVFQGWQHHRDGLLD